jgi:hypothetical protein
VRGFVLVFGGGQVVVGLAAGGHVGALEQFAGAVLPLLRARGRS